MVLFIIKVYNVLKYYKIRPKSYFFNVNDQVKKNSPVFFFFIILITL